MGSLSAIEYNESLKEWARLERLEMLEKYPPVKWWEARPRVWGFICDFVGCIWLSSVLASWILLTADFFFPFLGHR